jgi:hypothetical protein
MVFAGPGVSPRLGERLRAASPVAGTPAITQIPMQPDGREAVP